jgi:transposase
MKIETIDVEATIENTRKLLENDPGVSPALKSTIDVLLMLITILVNQLGLNSQNSSKPPSSDPNREKKIKMTGDRKAGGQKGHTGTTLQKFDHPDHIENISVDRKTLPKGTYKDVGYESRQIVDIEISRIVTEYRAQILEDVKGKQYTAPFPEGVNRPVQYGLNVKVHSVYMSQYQLVPYKRIEEDFQDQVKIPISAGTIFNFNYDAYHKLEAFESMVKSKLIESGLCHADETGININGKRAWLHCVSNDLWSYYLPHEKRGLEAMEEMGVLPHFKGILCHDHWKPYFKLDCLHALCNAHHLRELERAWEQDKQEWAREMKDLLLHINQAVDDAGGRLEPAESRKYRQKYRDLLDKAQNECPPPDQSNKKNKRGRTKRSKARNLLERLMNYEAETLRFMDDEQVPFTNNQGENDIRMTKVQQKISGCFRSKEGAAIFCRIRSYLSTCKKHGIRATEALRLLFEGRLPDFMNG